MDPKRASILFKKKRSKEIRVEHLQIWNLFGSNFELGAAGGGDSPVNAVGRRAGDKVGRSRCAAGGDPSG